jgi:flagellar protein FlaG
MDKISNGSQPVPQVKPALPLNDQGGQKSSNDQLDQKQKFTDELLNKAIDRINHTLIIDNTSLQIEFDKETNRNVAQIIDKNSGEVVRQIPSKEFLEWEKEFTRITGILFDKKA